MDRDKKKEEEGLLCVFFGVVCWSYWAWEHLKHLNQSEQFDLQVTQVKSFPLTDDMTGRERRRRKSREKRRG